MILSLTLEDPDGNAVAMEAKRLQKHLKVVVVAGRYPPDDLKPFVQKPFSMQQIDQAIKRVLLPPLDLSASV